MQLWPCILTSTFGSTTSCLIYLIFGPSSIYLLFAVSCILSLLLFTISAHLVRTNSSWRTSVFMILNTSFCFGLVFTAALMAVFIKGEDSAARKSKSDFQSENEIDNNNNNIFQLFAGYVCVMCIFHYSEYCSTSWTGTGGKGSDWNSFLINHSHAYVLAAGCSWIEFAIESFLLPGLKSFTWISKLGLLLCLLGEAIRKGAMLQAGQSFTHEVAWEKRKEHILVTNGLYKYCRHPSYLGWMLWSVGTQIYLLNPFCAVAYAAASWIFFNERIYEEELYLLQFFGPQYADYQDRVPTGLPFIWGYCKKTTD